MVAKSTEKDEVEKERRKHFCLLFNFKWAGQGRSHWTRSSV